MTKIKKPSILTPKTLLSGLAGISLIVGISLAPVSFAYADGGNDGPDINVSDSESEAGENSMSNPGLNMENSAREIGDAARNAADDVREQAESMMNDHANEASGNGSDHADQQPNMDENAPPMLLADFISSLRNGNSIISSDGAATNMELRYANGWKEEIDHGRYVLVDPNGNKIITRPVTDADISRMRSALQ